MFYFQKHGEYFGDSIRWHFFSALFFNFVLLPLGKEYTLFYLFISIPLICSYGISMFMHDKATVFEPKVSAKIYSGGSDNCNREGEI